MNKVLGNTNLSLMKEETEVLYARQDKYKYASNDHPWNM